MIEELQSLRGIEGGLVACACDGLQQRWQAASAPSGMSDWFGSAIGLQAV